MARSLTSGPLSHTGRWPAARTPGPLGWLDQADPGVCALLGDTPGPLGIGDLGDPTLPPAFPGRPLFSAALRLPDGTPLAPVAGSPPTAALGPPRLAVAALGQVFPDADAALLQRVADDVATDPVAYGLDSTLRQAHFLAQLREEAGADLAQVEENLRYSPAGLKATFPGYYGARAAEADADGYAIDPATRKVTRSAAVETIANKVYAGRNGNGNAASGDGWLFRGRGMKQITGRANYAAVTRRYRLLYPGDPVDFEQTPGVLCDFPYSLRSAVCFWIGNGLHRLADAGSEGAHVDAITAVINRYTKSDARRRSHFDTAWAALR